MEASEWLNSSESLLHQKCWRKQAESSFLARAGRTTPAVPRKLTTYTERACENAGH